MRPILLLLTAAAACQTGGNATADRRDSTQGALATQVQSQLRRAADSWNRGDLESFLSDYAAESTTTFVDGRRARHGFEFIREYYAPRFAAGARRDSLRFEEIEARSLSPALSLVTARFILTRHDSVTASGPFTLVMQQRSGRWQILHDHSSSDPR
jgi:uncharacterized protein (TIGR02246 family)